MQPDGRPAVQAGLSCRRRLQLAPLAPPLPMALCCPPTPHASHLCHARQRAPKRLRQLESVAGRGLLLGCGTKQQAPAAHYVVLAARCPSVAAAEDGAAGSSSSGEDEWRIIYRSEAVSPAGGTTFCCCLSAIWWCRARLMRLFSPATLMASLAQAPGLSSRFPAALKVFILIMMFVPPHLHAFSAVGRHLQP